MAPFLRRIDKSADLLNGRVSTSLAEPFMPDGNSDQKIIKVAVTAAEQDTIRLAAALRRTSMADYARTVVLADAERLTASIMIPKSPKSQTKNLFSEDNSSAFDNLPGDSLSASMFAAKKSARDK